MDNVYFLAMGLHILGRNVSESVEISNRRFKECFGASPEVCSMLWRKLDHSHPVGAEGIHLMMALHFLKCYDTECVNASLFGVDEKTYRKWQWIYVSLIAWIDIVRK